MHLLPWMVPCYETVAFPALPMSSFPRISNFALWLECAVIDSTHISCAESWDYTSEAKQKHNLYRRWFTTRSWSCEIWYALVAAVQIWLLEHVCRSLALDFFLLTIGLSSNIPNIQAPTNTCVCESRWNPLVFYNYFGKAHSCWDNCSFLSWM